MACMWNYEGWQIPAHCLEGVLREARWPLVSRGRSAWSPPPALQPPSDPILPTRCLAAATSVAVDSNGSLPYASGIQTK